MEYVKQLVGLPIMIALVLLVFRPSVLKHTAAYWRKRREGQVDAYFASDYGRRMVRSMRLAACVILGCGLLLAPPIALPGSYLLAASMGGLVFVGAIPLPLRKQGQGVDSIAEGMGR
jgi:hypothetical protein